MLVGCYNVTMFFERLRQAAFEQCGLRQDLPILLGVSGGADSLALLHGLDALGFKLVIAHLDHALRPEAHLDAEFVQNLVESQGFPFIKSRVDVGQVAKSEGQSVEEAARSVRYQFLFEQARLNKCQAVAVGHHADDQVETVLMHFLRGAALPGLSGMAYRRFMPQWEPSIPLVRPLLGIWREEIDAYVAEIGWRPCVDSSNLDTIYHRNRIRHELIPELETYNPQIKRVVWRMADILDEEVNFLAALTERVFDEITEEVTDDRVVLSLLKFQQLEKALQRRVLRQAIAKLRPDLRDIGYVAIARGIRFIKDTAAGGEIDLVARLNLAIIGSALILKTWKADLPDFGQPLLPTIPFEGLLEVGKHLDLKNGWWIEASMIGGEVELPIESIQELGPDEAWLDFNRLELPLMVRGRKEGERFQPLGMGGHTQRLKDFFINKKIPGHLRSLWPLVISGQQVAWVVGLRPSEAFKVTNSTRRIIKLQLKQHSE